MTDTPAEPTATQQPNFSSLGLPASILGAVSKLGYETPTPIQARTIPALLAGRDVLGQAQTGSGKTAAFALPLLARLDLARRQPQLLVLVPTRELAIQVTEACQTYGAGLPGLELVPIYGGQDIMRQLRHLRSGVHAVVATPGRLMDHLRRGSLKLDTIAAVVLDEADEMLRMGFIDEVREVLAAVPQTRQLALFSATMPREIRAIADTELRDPVCIDLPVTAASTTIRQRHCVVDGRQKVEALARMLEVEDCAAALIFVRTRNATAEVASKLAARGYAVASLSGDVAQPERERIVARLADGSLDLVVATDVAARGLDIDRLSHVFHFDAPHDAESYVHRCGRTGRAGRSGDAILMLAPRERHLLRHLERAVGGPIPRYEMPSNEAINDRRLTRFRERLTAALAKPDPEAEIFSRLIDEVAQASERSEREVAATLARLAHGDERLLLDPRQSAPVMPHRAPPHASARQRDHIGDDGHHGAPGGHLRPDRGNLVRYRLDVGRLHRVQPGHIVGALTNEGGIARRDLGRIAIHDAYSTIELPPELPRGLLRHLHGIRVQGRPLRCEPM